jgi:hypothetical protein
MKRSERKEDGSGDPALGRVRMCWMEDKLQICFPNLLEVTFPSWSEGCLFHMIRL